MQENIGSFGGDSTEVTVFGESAGSASIAYHLLSPLAKGLFKVTLLPQEDHLAVVDTVPHSAPSFKAAQRWHPAGGPSHQSTPDDMQG